MRSTFSTRRLYRGRQNRTLLSIAGLVLAGVIAGGCITATSPQASKTVKEKAVASVKAASDSPATHPTAAKSPTKSSSSTSASQPGQPVNSMQTCVGANPGPLPCREQTVPSAKTCPISSGAAHLRLSDKFLAPDGLPTHGPYPTAIPQIGTVTVGQVVVVTTPEEYPANKTTVHFTGNPGVLNELCSALILPEPPTALEVQHGIHQNPYTWITELVLIAVKPGVSRINAVPHSICTACSIPVWSGEIIVQS